MAPLRKRNPRKRNSAKNLRRHRTIGCSMSVRSGSRPGQLASELQPGQRYPWKSNIVTTIFWIGEKPSENNPVPNRTSSWDKQWTKNYGGVDDPNPAHRSNYIPVNLHPDRTHSTARFPTTTKRGRDTAPRHRALSRGLTKRIRVQPFRLAKVAGLPSAKATEPRMRSGKTPDHSAPTTGNTFSVTNGQNLISIKAPASMFRPLCAITWDCNQLTSPTGGSWISKKCHVVRGQRTATTTRS